jgi:polyisoprenoid-binding protein YceI
MTTNTLTAPSGLDGLATGRWTVDPARSRLALDARVCGGVGVRGRFTELAGHLDVAPDPLASRIRIAVATASLTSGSRRLDALLDASGLIDPSAGPAIRYRSAALHPPTTSGTWHVTGTLSTARGGRPLALELTGPPPVGDARIRLHARGEVTRADISELLARPGAARLFGATARLDLQIELTAPEGDR